MTNIKHDMGPADKPRDDVNRYFVAAYTASPTVVPASTQWDPIIERQYFQALAKRPDVIGIEHPFYMGSEKYNLDWLLEAIPDHWSIILTVLPTFMMAMKTNPYLGLASTHEHDRSLAVKMMEQASAYVSQLNQAFGRQIVKAIHFHSLPKNDVSGFRGHKEALKKSLIDIKDLDWQGAELNLEHCDAYIPGQLAEKGFLFLEDEIEVLSEVGGFGLMLNWARSAIEGRSVMTPLTHIQMARKTNLLKGFFFSGCTDDPKSSYGAWKDAHMPPGGGSLLRAEEIQQAFCLLEPEVYLGIKVADASPQKTLERSINLNLDAIYMLTSRSYTQSV